MTDWPFSRNGAQKSTCCQSTGWIGGSPLTGAPDDTEVVPPRVAFAVAGADVAPGDAFGAGGAGAFGPVEAAGGDGDPAAAEDEPATAGDVFGAGEPALFGG